MSKGRKKLIALGIAAVAVIVSFRAVSCTLRLYDPNEQLKKNATEITAGTEYAAEFRRSKGETDVYASTASFKFEPVESAEYTFMAESNAAGSNVVMKMYVMDESLSELLTADNSAKDKKGGTVSDSMDGTVFLTKGQLHYAVIEAFSDDETALESFESSFRFSVMKAGDLMPEELKTGEKVRLTVKKDRQACAMFIPDETSFYHFDTRIVSRDADTGFSSVYDITSEDETLLTITDGICLLEAGKTYYVWVGVDESTKKRSRVELSCSKMASESASGICSVEINDRTVIEYTAEDDMLLMISSSSDGDPDIAVYDTKGFMLRQDDDSGGSVSGNPKDFALGLRAGKGEAYRICIFGRFTQCTVNIEEYTGDGTAPDGDPADEEEQSPEEESEQ